MNEYVVPRQVSEFCDRLQEYGYTEMVGLYCYENRIRKADIVTTGDVIEWAKKQEERYRDINKLHEQFTQEQREEYANSLKWHAWLKNREYWTDQKTADFFAYLEKDY